MRTEALKNMINSGGLDETLGLLYGRNEKTLAAQRERYIQAADRFAALFEQEDVQLFSAPGRSEIGGNHTDHQNGCALAAAVNLDAAAAVAFREDGVIRLYSEGYGMTELSLCDSGVHPTEKGTTAALIRGVCDGFAERGVRVGGFDAYVTSEVLSGSGLSSSAAFETLIGTILNEHAGGSFRAAEIAKIGQYAENVYFGKNSGLLDQTACAEGGMVSLDFRDSDHPSTEKLDVDFGAAGFDLCVTDTKGSHANLTGDYAAIPEEMCSVAAFFGKRVLREVDEQAFYRSIPALHGRVSDRAVLRAMHFFGENRRAAEEAEALKQGDFERFFTLFRQSAASSAFLLQNLYPTEKPLEQGIPLAIAVSRSVLGEDACVRVHGGGFAGTVQAFVPREKTAVYQEKMNALFGEGSCDVLRIRPVGGVRVI